MDEDVKSLVLPNLGNPEPVITDGQNYTRYSVQNGNGTFVHTLSNDTLDGKHVITLKGSGVGTWSATDVLPKIGWNDLDGEETAIAILGKDSTKIIAVFGGIDSVSIFDGSYSKISKIKYPDGTVGDLGEEFKLKYSTDKGNNRIYDEAGLEYIHNLAIKKTEEHSVQINPTKNPEIAAVEPVKEKMQHIKLNEDCYKAYKAEKNNLKIAGVEHNHEGHYDKKLHIPKDPNAIHTANKGYR